ncbi:MAG: glucose-1-phosphate adenylyltransferase subunit GlgD [Defluviitaleaceae bacterium]|nr:glucose-1-phosphate adenylyltransferase subunit GlgD [Defluviitaleaceae bacterium]
MKIDVAGIILAGGGSDRLGVLTSERAASAMPIAGCYRAIDFTLSNMTNSGIKKAAVITQYNSRSLRDHLSSSKWWDFGRKQGGLFVFSPFTSKDGNLWFRGTSDSIYQNMPFLHRSSEEYVLIVNGNGIYKMDYSNFLDYHIETGADITIAYQKSNDRDPSKAGMLELDHEGVITNFEEKPVVSDYNKMSLGIYILKRELLIQLLEETVPNNFYDITRDIIIRYLKKLKICGYEFSGYWSAVNDIESYLNLNMDFLNKEVRAEILDTYPYIYTKPKDEPPAKYNPGADVKKAIIGDGAILNGLVENSVLFRKVYVGDHSVIKNSVIMEDSHIGNNCHIENAIIDKEATISDNKHIIGTLEEPYIVPKGTRI